MTKIAYAGIDLLHPVLSTLLEEDVTVMKLFTCRTDNVFEYNTAVIRTAREKGIPVSLDRITARDLENLRDDGCQALICAAYYYRIPVVDGIRMINVHPAPLPHARGAWPMPYAILEGWQMGAVCIHKMAADFDTGDVMLQKEFPLDPETETLETYMDKACAILPGMIKTLLASWDALYTNARKQGEGRYLPNPDESAYTLSAADTAKHAELITRAFWGYDMYYRTPEKTYAFSRPTVRKTLPPPDENTLILPLADGYLCVDRKTLFTKE